MHLKLTRKKNILTYILKLEKRRKKSHWNIKRIEPIRITNQLVEFYENLSRGKQLNIVLQ